MYQKEYIKFIFKMYIHKTANPIMLHKQSSTTTVNVHKI